MKNKFHKDLENDNEFVVILKGHLYVEHELNNLLEKQLSNPEVLNIQRKGFYDKAQLACALGLVDDALLDAMLCLNSLRNKFTHNLNYKLKKKDTELLLSKLKVVHDDKLFDGEIILNDEKGKLVNIRVCIVALKVFVELKGLNPKSA